jgi:hypothetical protein
MPYIFIDESGQFTGHNNEEYFIILKNNILSGGGKELFKNYWGNRYKNPIRYFWATIRKSTHKELLAKYNIEKLFAMSILL